MVVASVLGCSSPTTSEQLWNQRWEPRYQEFLERKRAVVSADDAVELLRLALQAKGINFRAHILSNIPRWQETVYQAFDLMPYPMLRHQEAISSFMKGLGYGNGSHNNQREIAPEDQVKILTEFSRLLSIDPLQTRQH